MMDIAPFIAKLLDYGILGMGVAILIFFIYRMQGFYNQERGEWLKTNKEHTIMMVEVINRNTEVISGIKAIVESIDKRVK